MPDDLMGPYEALGIVRTFAQIALDNDEPSVGAYELILREILKACDLALPTKGPDARSPKPSKPDQS